MKIKLFPNNTHAMVNFSMKYYQYFCCAKICYMHVAANNDVSCKEGNFLFEGSKTEKETVNFSIL